MDKRIFLAMPLILVVAVILIGIFFQATTRTDNIHRLSEDAKTLAIMTPEQREQYQAQALQILAVRRQQELSLVRQSYLWASIWRVVVFCGVIGGVSIGFTVIVRKSRPYSMTMTTDPDGRSVSVKIPIIPETAEERLMYATAPVVRNLALAQGEVNEQTRQMVGAIAQTIKSMSSVSKRAALPLQPQEPQMIEAETPLALSAGEVLATPRDDQRFVLGEDSETHNPILCSLAKQIFHLNIAGQTGSGKTTSLRFYLSQWLQNNIVDRAFLCDNHMSNPEGLTMQMGALTRLPHVTTCKEMLPKDMIALFGQEMSERIEQKKSWKDVWVLILDEGLALLDGIKGLQKMLERGTTESRKFGMFLVIVAQTQKHTQIPTEVRDNFPSMLVHRMKPKQANLLLQDKERSRRTGRLKQGQAYFVDAIGEYEGVVNIPLMSSDDVQQVVQRIGFIVPESVIDLPLEREKILLPSEIQMQIRGMLSNDFRLHDVHKLVFVDGQTSPVMALGTFLTKFKDPEKRPWKPKELSMLSRWVMNYCQSA